MFQIPWMIIAAISVGSTLFSMSQKSQAADARVRQIEMESKKSSIKRMEESISNYDILDRTLKTQLAESTVRGVAPDSLSFEAIQRQTINQISTEEKRRGVEETLFQEGLKIEKRNVQNSLYASLFGDVAQVGFNVSRLASSTPTTGAS